MRYWKCKCGAYESFGSDGPRPCQVCNKCGTTLLKRIDGSYIEAEPHDWVTETNIVTREGYDPIVKIKTYCLNCFQRKPEE
jgi:hypothetical protein